MVTAGWDELRQRAPGQDGAPSPWGRGTPWGAPSRETPRAKGRQAGRPAEGAAAARLAARRWGPAAPQDGPAGARGGKDVGARLRGAPPPLRTPHSGRGTGAPGTCRLRRAARRARPRSPRRFMGRIRTATFTLESPILAAAAEALARLPSAAATGQLFGADPAGEEACGVGGGGGGRPEGGGAGRGGACVGEGGAGASSGRAPLPDGTCSLCEDGAGGALAQRALAGKFPACVAPWNLSAVGAVVKALYFYSFLNHRGE